MSRVNDISHEYQIELIDGKRYIEKAKSQVEAVTKLKRRLNRDFIVMNVRLYRQIARK